MQAKSASLRNYFPKIGYALFFISIFYLCPLVTSGAFVPKKVIQYSQLTVSEDDKYVSFGMSIPYTSFYKMELSSYAIQEIKRIDTNDTKNSTLCPDLTSAMMQNIEASVYTSDCTTQVVIVREDENAYFNWLYSERIFVLDDNQATEIHVTNGVNKNSIWPIDRGDARYLVVALLVTILLGSIASKNFKTLLGITIALAISYLLFFGCYLYMWLPVL